MRETKSFKCSITDKQCSACITLYKWLFVALTLLGAVFAVENGQLSEDAHLPS
jgi:hypothetical protein